MVLIVELVELCRALNYAYAVSVDLRRSRTEVREHTTEGIQNVINKPHLRKYCKRGSKQPICFSMNRKTSA